MTLTPAARTPARRACSTSAMTAYLLRFRMWARRHSTKSTVTFNAVCRDCEQKQRNIKKNADRPRAIIEQRARSAATKAGAVYIGRPSKWGNPFVIRRHGTREEVIAKYERFLCDTPAGRALLEQIRELRGKDLVCWCAPLPCHGDLLLRLANQDNA
jgi:hypothetical protein